MKWPSGEGVFVVNDNKTWWLVCYQSFFKLEDNLRKKKVFKDWPWETASQDSSDFYEKGYRVFRFNGI